MLANCITKYTLSIITSHILFGLGTLIGKSVTQGDWRNYRKGVFNLLVVEHLASVRNVLLNKNIG
jgi:hypothetical protein